MKQIKRSAFLHWRLDKLIREADKRGHPQATNFFRLLKSRLICYPQAYKRDPEEPRNITLGTVIQYSVKYHLRHLPSVGERKVAAARAFIKSIDPTVDFYPDDPGGFGL